MNSLIERIAAFHTNRNTQTLAMKYKVMAADAFSFYRGTCHLFYEDLQTHPFINTGPLVWNCGDLHMENFGSYRAANGLAYFDINDFDEAALAPASWDLSRFLCSIGMAAELWDYTLEEAEELMLLFLQHYTDQLRTGKAYAIQSETSPELIQEFFAMAQKEKEGEMIKARMDRKSERLKLIPGKTISIDPTLRAQIMEASNAFLKEQHEGIIVKDALFRIAGTGSLGVKRYVLLAWDEQKEKWRLLDIKESLPSSLTPFLKTPQPVWKNDGERVTWIQGRMQYAPPRFTGVFTIDQHAYVLKQLQPSSQKIDYRLCDRKMKNVETVIETMASALSSAQIRSAWQKGSASVDELILFAERNGWRNELVKLAKEYVPVMRGYFGKFRTSANH